MAGMAIARAARKTGMRTMMGKTMGTTMRKTGMGTARKRIAKMKIARTMRTRIQRLRPSLLPQTL